MMFIDFCRAHGLIVDYVINDGKWHRVKTIDHTSKKNGAYIYDGVRGAVQNWATMEKAESWKTDKPFNIAEHRRQMREIGRQEVEAAAKAAKKARYMLEKSELKPFDYLHLQGFPDAKMHTLTTRDGKEMGLIPVRVNGEITSLQTLVYDAENRRWIKKFLAGGLTKCGVFIFGSRGDFILCEGYATGMSVFAAAQKANIQVRVVVCFSAHNMVTVSHKLKPRLVIADNDASGTGERVAIQIGAPYWMSETVGNDFNDDHKQRGLFAVSNDLRKLFIRRVNA